VLDRNRNIQQFEWAIPRRARSLELLLGLYKYADQHGDLVNDAESRRLFGLLVGASFSLWRAVFFAQLERDWVGNDGILSGAKDLLEKVLENNAILFGDEKRIEGWSVGYYLNNAYFRIERALQHLPQSDREPPLVKFSEQVSKGITADSPHEIWDIGCGAAFALLALLERRDSA